MLGRVTLEFQMEWPTTGTSGRPRGRAICSSPHAPPFSSSASWVSFSAASDRGEMSRCDEQVLIESFPGSHVDPRSKPVLDAVGRREDLEVPTFAGHQNGGDRSLRPMAQRKLNQYGEEGLLVSKPTATHGSISGTRRASWPQSSVIS